MEILSKNDIIDNQNIIDEIIAGKIFIYPTDTIYGIGCNALISESVHKIRTLKQRPDNPFSVIAPSKGLITKNFDLNSEYLDKLPGKYTYVMKPKTQVVTKITNPKTKMLGVRIPDNWFTKIIQKAGVPFITTSVNITNMPNMTYFENLNQSIKSGVDYLIDEGEIKGSASKVIMFDGEDILELR